MTGPRLDCGPLLIYASQPQQPPGLMAPRTRQAGDIGPDRCSAQVDRAFVSGA